MRERGETEDQLFLALKCPACRNQALEISFSFSTKLILRVYIHTKYLKGVV